MSNVAKKKPVETREESPIFRMEVIEAFCTGLKETLTTMAAVEVSFGRSTIASDWISDDIISACIEFETSQFRGSIFLHLPNQAIIKLYNQMMGENHVEITTEIIESIGEISNIAYGVAKGKLDPLQMHFSMSLPKLVKTKYLNRLPSPHLNLPFQIYDYQCNLEISLGKNNTV